MSTGDFESRLHKQLKSLVSARTDSYEKEVERLHGALQAALTDAIKNALQENLPQLTQVARQTYGSVPDATEISALAAEMSAAVDAVCKERDAALSAASQASPSTPQLDMLKSAIFEIQGYKTQAEVLSALVEHSAAFVPRVALFIVKSGNAVGWLARGFDRDGAGDEAVRGQTISLGADTTLRKALSRQATYCEPPLEHIENRQLYSIFAGTLPTTIATVPLVVRGKSAAVLYADSTAPELNVDALDILVNIAALTVELISVRPKGAEVPARHQPAASVVSKPTPAQPPMPSVAPETPPKFAPPAPPTPKLEPPPPAAPSFEFTPTPPTPKLEPPSPAESKPAPPPAPISEDEKKLHNDARRFARLLVSEIKLYNEQKVAEGRKNKDLYDRLKEDIDRSRQMYDKRVSPIVAAKFDYFYDELLNTLGESDPTKLGSDCPGPILIPLQQ